jgi:hypothetical protein
MKIKLTYGNTFQKYVHFPFRAVTTAAIPFLKLMMVISADRCLHATSKCEK